MLGVWLLACSKSPDTKEERLQGQLMTRWAYFGQVFKKWWGMLSVALTAATAIAFLLLGGTLPGKVFTPILAVFTALSFLYANYRVNLESSRTIETLSSKIVELETNHPSLALQFVAEGSLSNNLYVDVECSSEPDYDDLVDRERMELEDRYSSSLRDATPLARLSGLRENPNYRKESKEYLVTYREYLVESHEAELAKTRTIELDIALINDGDTAVEDITIELIARHPLRARTWEEVEAAENDPVAPPRPSLTPHFGDLGAISRALTPNYIPAISQVQAPSPIVGPKLSFADRIVVATYRVQRIAPGYIESRFDTLSLWLEQGKRNNPLRIDTVIYGAQLHQPRKSSLFVITRRVGVN